MKKRLWSCKWQFGDDHGECRACYQTQQITDIGDGVSWVEEMWNCVDCTCWERSEAWTDEDEKEAIEWEED